MECPAYIQNFIYSDGNFIYSNGNSIEKETEHKQVAVNSVSQWPADHT